MLKPPTRNIPLVLSWWFKPLALIWHRLSGLEDGARPQWVWHHRSSLQWQSGECRSLVTGLHALQRMLSFDQLMMRGIMPIVDTVLISLKLSNLPTSWPPWPGGKDQASHRKGPDAHGKTAASAEGNGLHPNHLRQGAPSFLDAGCSGQRTIHMNWYEIKWCNMSLFVWK